ncbi:MAG: hypothetical protein A3I29_04540 [Candidatus Magasanikbacteria bacterium RIFCSPLOWO2_02_FULL_44_11]|uniref:Uncharacterized protein n=2 Tax=Candidatus Magasanikiibacteriota TaxID=1752731 RepID=A0A1F6N9B8_9BACT|nr:MAG: hypothetical protein A3D53_03690 [Candidatus Magasanikbacteria bacterium RIFCSPHIGHO2_02_FULL_45_10]OGH80504.1 MAG: hypothetical protein A3I29_04540 [Candidatus Magasanikbacteria bacterium RIFCSPLOWO2_02_FULL_44_11]
MLSTYHSKYSERTRDEIKRRSAVKEEELKRIFNEINFATTSDPVRVAVLGCADTRFVPKHKEIFEKIFNRSVELTTFDISQEHLKDQPGFIQHDCTLPLPNQPYDITFGHVLLKFIETEKQWDIIKNSYDGLISPGLAIHIFDEEDVTTKETKQKDGYWSLPLERWAEELKKKNMKYKILNWSISLEGVPIPIRGLKGGALVLIK